MPETTLHAVSEEIVELAASGHTAAPFSARFPNFDAAMGYRVALRLHQHRLAIGWKPVGRKIGFTNRNLWKRYGVHEPIWGFLYEQTVVHAPDDVAHVPLRDLAQPRIEPEIAFRLKAAPPRSHDPRALLAAIEWAAHSCEIVQCHYPDWKLALADSIADNALHGRLIIGKPVPIQSLRGMDWRLPKTRVTLRRAGKVIDEGVAANVLDSPLFALGHLAELLAIQSEFEPLAAGDLVTTGTMTDAHPVKPGESWSTEIEGIALPGLSIHFT